MVKQIFLSDTWFARGLADASELKYVLIWNRNKETWGGESKKPCHSSEHVGYKFYKNGTFYWRIKRVFAYKSDLLFDPLYCALHSFILGKPDFPLCHFTFFYQTFMFFILSFHPFAPCFVHCSTILLLLVSLCTCKLNLFFVHFLYLILLLLNILHRLCRRRHLHQHHLILLILRTIHSDLLSLE